MYARLLKLVGVNIIQGIIISSAVMIGKTIYRKIKIDRVNKKYDNMRKEYENDTLKKSKESVNA